MGPMVIELQYLAGYFDADGSIAITRWKKPNGHYIYQIKATVTSISPLILNEFKRRWEGSLLVTDWGHKKNPNNRIRGDWSVTSKRCMLFLIDIGPHLIFKQDQVQVALKMQESIEQYPGGISSTHPEYNAVMDYRQSLYNDIAELKKIHYFEHHWDGGEFGEHPNGRKRRGRPRAKQDGYSRLSNEQIEQIRSLQGVKRQVDIASEFGISQTQVSRIQSGRV